MSLQSTNKLSDKASIEIIVPPEVILNSKCYPIVITSAAMRIDVKCEISPSDHRIVLTDSFYSFGYDPQLDRKIIFNITDVITKNPTSLLENLNFTVRTLEVNPFNEK